MDQYESLIGMISLSMGAAWASGINLYAALLILGIGGATGNIALPEELQIIQNPMVIIAAGLMYATEFVADKIPGVDSSWDALHTFIRIPAGAMLAAGAVGDVSPALDLAAGILGGSMAATSHAAKAGTRLAVNTSPEPFSNWGLSISEDVAVFAGLWAALVHPWVFVGLMIIFIVLAIWLIPKLWRFIKLIGTRLGQLFGFIDKPAKQDASFSAADLPTTGLVADSLLPPAEPPVDSPVDSSSTSADSDVEQLSRLKSLLDQGAINEDEYNTLKNRILDQN